MKIKERLKNKKMIAALAGVAALLAAPLSQAGWWYHWLVMRQLLFVLRLSRVSCRASCPSLCGWSRMETWWLPSLPSVKLNTLG